jgi:CelD/BcsL family acetyltransferase involved in cellulose biosynthesis
MHDLELKEISPEERAALRPSWQSLAETEPAMSLFETPMWVETYGRHRSQAGRTETTLAAWDANGTLAGVVLLARDRMTWRRLPGLRAIHSTGEYVSDWSCGPGHAESFVAAIYDHLVRRHRNWFHLKMTAVPEDSPVLGAWRTLCQARRLPYTESTGAMVPFVDVSVPGQDASKLTKSKYRREVARKGRELAKLGEVSFDEASAGADLGASFEEFLVVEASGWKSRDGGAIACQPDARAFWWSLVEQAAAAGKLRLQFLRCDGKPVAAQLGVTWHDRYYCLRVGYDESYRRHGPGALLTQYVLQCCIDDPEIRIYDFAGVARPYMWNWTSSAYGTFNISVGRPELLPALAYRGLFHGRRMLSGLRRLPNKRPPPPPQQSYPN